MKKMSNIAQCLLILVLFGIGWQTADSGTVQLNQRKCEPITVPLCQTMNYNLTRLPNYFVQNTQQDVQFAIEKYADFIQSNCSSQLVFFFCTLSLPICLENMGLLVLPCRSVCQKVEQECNYLLKRSGGEWAKRIDCNDFPVYHTDVCIKPEAFVMGRGENPTNIDLKAESLSCPPCQNTVRPTYHNFVRNNYKYSIVAEVISVTATVSGETISRVLVSKVLQHSEITIQKGPIVLWSNSTCLCPNLLIDKQYVIIGHQDMATERLLLARNSIVQTVKNSEVQDWKDKLEKWLRKAKNQDDRKPKQKHKNGQRKHRRNRPTLRTNNSRRFRWIWLK